MNALSPFPLTDQDFTAFPNADDALADLENFMPLVWEAMDSAITGTASFFLSDGVRLDPSLAPNLVRHYAKRFFANRNLATANEEDAMTPAFDSIGLANNGLCVVRGRYAIRIRKSDNGLIPVPGPSYTLQQFYRQQPLPFNLMNKPAQVVDTSLLLLWQVDADYRLAGMELACPRAGSTTRASVEFHWSVPLQNPILTRAVTKERQAVADLDGIEAITDVSTIKHG